MPSADNTIAFYTRHIGSTPFEMLKRYSDFRFFETTSMLGVRVRLVTGVLFCYFGSIGREHTNLDMLYILSGVFLLMAGALEYLVGRPGVYRYTCIPLLVTGATALGFAVYEGKALSWMHVIALVDLWLGHDSLRKARRFEPMHFQEPTPQEEAVISDLKKHITTLARHDLPPTFTFTDRGRLAGHMHYSGFLCDTHLIMVTIDAKDNTSDLIAASRQELEISPNRTGFLTNALTGKKSCRLRVAGRTLRGVMSEEHLERVGGWGEGFCIQKQ